MSVSQEDQVEDGVVLHLGDYTVGENLMLVHRLVRVFSGHFQAQTIPKDTPSSLLPTLTPQLSPVWAEEWYLHFESLPDVCNPHPISYSAEKTHSSHFYLQSGSFSDNLHLMTTGEGQNIDRPLNQELRPPS